MKRAIVPILVLLLTCAIVVALARLGLNRQPSQSAQINPSSRLIEQRANAISYEGVSFTFDPSLTSEVRSETIPAMANGKPSDIVPEHPAFTLLGYPRPNGLSESDPQIRVFATAKFREAVGLASKEDAKMVVYPPNPLDWTVYYDEEVRVLKELLAAKPPQESISRFLANARSEPGCGARMPFLPMWEACQAFVGHLRYVNFKGGQGVFFLTQWDRETTQITNEGLEYTYQGITDDGLYYVYAEFSVATPFLPMGNEPEVVAWAEKNYLLPHASKTYQRYLRPVLAQLEALPADKFEPNLDLLEQLIGSLEVQAK